jgi:transcriptional regulator with XRE-family HTH domain
MNNLRASLTRWRKRKIDLGRRIRGRRESAGLTRQELAAKASMSQDAVRKIEVGDRMPSAGSATLLAQALGWTTEEMLR